MGLAFQGLVLQGLALLGLASPTSADLTVPGQLWAVLVSLTGLLLALVQAILPWTPLIAWIAFWLLAVNWQKLYPVLMSGAWIGVVLTAVMAVLVWSAVSIPESGTHHLFGLHVSNLVGKTVYVTSLCVIAILCGSVQLSGAVGNQCRFIEPAADAVADGHGYEPHAHH
jgi:hypothetical protein